MLSTVLNMFIAVESNNHSIENVEEIANRRRKYAIKIELQLINSRQDHVLNINEERIKTKDDQKFRYAFLIRKIPNNDRYNLIYNINSRKNYKYRYDKLRKMSENNIPNELDALVDY